MLFRKRKADGSGYSYSSLNVARSAISAIAKFSGVSAGNNDMVCFFMKSAATQQFQFLKINFTWDPDAFLHTFPVWGHNTHLSLSYLIKDVAGLLLILSGQGFQTIDCLDI